MIKQLNFKNVYFSNAQGKFDKINLTKWNQYFIIGIWQIITLIQK
jgi:hypothetical protein